MDVLTSQMGSLRACLGRFREAFLTLFVLSVDFGGFSRHLVGLFDPNWACSGDFLSETAWVSRIKLFRAFTPKGNTKNSPGSQGGPPFHHH